MLTALLWTATAQAQPDERAARAHFLAGRSYYDQARYEDALREFTEALHASPDEQKGLMVFNVGQAQERLGRIAAAIASFESYLDLQPRAEDRADVERRIATLRARLQETGIVLSVSEPGAHVFLDGRDVGMTPLAGPLPVEPGSHELRVQKEGYLPFRLRMSVDAGRRVEAEATLQAVARAGPAPTAPPGRRNALPWIAAGGAVLAIGAGTILGVMALGESDAANEEVAGDEDLYDDARSNAEMFALFSDVSFGVGVAAAATAIFLLVVQGADGESTHAATPALHATPVALRGGAGLALTGEL